MLSRILAAAKRRMELPETRGVDHDSPELIAIHRRAIEQKPFLRNLYREHYRELAKSLLGVPEGPIVELGSGGGFIKEVLPRTITTDLFPEPHLDRTMSAEHLDFPDASVAAILMLNVFHHLPEPRRFLAEADRVLAPGGRVVLIEPAHTMLWKRLYRLFSPEPYDENTRTWEFPSTGRFSGANVPAAWVVFQRDRTVFEKEFRRLRIQSIGHHSAFLYLLSGGIWYRGLVPAASFPIFRAVEKVLTPAMRLLAGQMTVVLEKGA